MKHYQATRRRRREAVVADLWSAGPPLSPEALAGILGCSGRYLRKLIAAGVLVAVRLPNAGRSHP